MKIQQINKFRNLQPWIIEVLNRLNIIKPTQIQRDTFGYLNKQKNLVGIAETGTGKTLAFCLPILNNLDFDKQLQALIIVPTKELAMQINAALTPFVEHNKHLNVKALVGGVDLEKQVNKDWNKNQIIIATPNRLKYFLENNYLDLRELKTLVFDEADMLMEHGFADDLDAVMQRISKLNVQKVSFSATLNEMLSIQIKKYFGDTKIVNSATNIYTNENIKHYIIHNHDKDHSLATLMRTIDPYLCLIFCNTKKQVEKIYKQLLDQKYNVGMFHGDLQKRERHNAYKKMKNLDFQYVVCSDLASRGLDIDGASHIISYDLPSESEFYVHRAGRAGRGKYTGESYVLYDNRQKSTELLKLVKKGIVFLHKRIRNNELSNYKYTWKTNKAPVDFKTNLEIKKAVLLADKKVKPGYKKKLKQTISKIQQKNKRAHIEKKMNAHRIRGYKMKNANK
ncbi:DEAD/DEAH box helicase [Ureaplasma miroungigenitalium]|uniref:DEAD/DEAH box helicase n=1 Tax=Ureaplasma miroungigenitalium TaxID=1042321 RepID=A0ABT3BN32_9BACT|nr:DEAD/DEAH box helicase [Ureaplasma miroungigenitalium]MCV3728643.1 DEAD/DEAH box helicase [Ureaplasma miroungigenitalium]MCV3734334.1 DEAD/DEAH box helicase [Ureaplasma miroungigenitalium]